MKKTLFIILLTILSILVQAQSYTPVSGNRKHTGTNWFTKALNIMGVTLSGTDIASMKAVVAADENALQINTITVMKTDSVNPTAGSYTSRYDFEKENPTPDLLFLMQKLGSDLKGLPIAPSLPTTYTTMEDSVIHFTAIYIPKGGILTGVHVGMANVTGNYVASSTGFNGVVLYSSNGTTLTAVAQSANTKNNWTGNAYEGKDIPFTSPYTATAGVYYVGVYMNYITSTVVPALMSAASYNAGHASSLKTGATGSTVYVSCKKVNVATLQTTFTLSTLTGDSYALYTTVY